VIRIIYLNARSICSKLNDLEILLNDEKPDLVLICETWCNSDVTNAMLNVPGYFIEPDLRVDRKDTTNGIGGGLIVYVKEGLMIKPSIVNNNFNQFTQFEVLNKSKNFINLNITLIYRPPGANELNTEELCKLIESSGTNSLFIGDFNFPSIDWKYETSNKKCSQFLQCVKDNLFEQLIDFSTHTGGNTLDLLLSNQPDKLLNIESLGNLANSDHAIIMVEMTFNSSFNKTIECLPDWKNADTNGLSQYFESVMWDHALHQLTVEESWAYFKDTVILGIDSYVPKILRRTRKRPQWMTKPVMKLIRLKQGHYKVYMQTRLIEHKDRFVKTQTQCKRAVRSAKRKFEQKIATNGNKRPFNSYIKSRTKSRVNVGPLKVGSVTISDDTGMATELNNFFCTVFFPGKCE